MRALAGALVRSRCMGAVVEKLRDKQAWSNLMGRVAHPKSVNCHLSMELYRKVPYPFHAPVRWSSSESSGGAANPDSLELVKQTAEYAMEYIKNHPEILDYAAYTLPTISIYLLMRLRYKSVKFNEFEKCISISLANTEKQLLKFYPMAAVGLLAFSEMSMVIAPSMQIHLSQLWHAASVVSIISFLHMLRENFVIEAKKRDSLIDRKWISNFDKISSITLISLGFLGAAEVAGISLQSLATISGAGGVVTAFAGKDIIGNILNGFSLQFTDRFSVGEYIKVGSVEGTVVDIGLTSTSLINPEHLPIAVPNSYFLGQVVVNRSRATVLSSMVKIPVKTEDCEKLVALTRQVSLMVKGNPLVALENERPCCYISRVGKLYGELVICCEIKLRNEGLIGFEQDIMLETLKIMKSVGVEVGDALPSGDLEDLLEAAQLIKSRGAAYTG